VPDYKNEALSSNSSIAKKEKSPQDNYMCIYIYLCVIYIHIHLILFVYMKGNLESKKNFKSSSKWKRKKKWRGENQWSNSRKWGAFPYQKDHQVCDSSK
jgi:hypothetical protein